MTLTYSPGASQIGFSLPPPGVLAGSFLGAWAVSHLSQVRPPGAFGLDRVFHPVFKSSRDGTAGPVLIFVLRRRIHDAGDMPRAAQHIGQLAAEELGSPEHGAGRRDVIFLGGQLIDRES